MKTHAVIDLILGNSEKEVIEFVGTLQDCEAFLEDNDDWTYKIVPLTKDEIASYNNE